MKIHPPPAWLFWACVISVLVLFATRGPPAKGQETPDEWFALAIELQGQIHRITNEPDRRFLREVVNRLAVSEDTMPTRVEQFWLKSIKAELERKRR